MTVDVRIAAAAAVAESSLHQLMPPKRLKYLHRHFGGRNTTEHCYCTVASMDPANVSSSR